MAEQIGAQERAMAERLAVSFGRAVDASLAEKDVDALEPELVSYLRDAYAIEAQAAQLLQAGPAIAGCEELAEVFRDHLHETHEHQRLVKERLRARGSGPARFQDTAMRLGGLNLGALFKAQPDTPVKLAGFAYAFEHLEIAAYELLLEVAERARDAASASVAKQIIAQERAAAERIAGTWDAAVDAALASVGASASA
jgi:ferritin-like metal-binding protein YciE